MYSMKRDKSVPATQRYALMNLLSEKGVPFSAWLELFEPMENMTDGEKENYAKDMIAKIRADEVDL